MEEHNRSIDVIKGICIVLVIITHFSWTREERLEMLFPFWVDMAVPIFMALSGYVCAKSYIRKNIISFDIAYEPVRILKRILRFTVPYVICFGVEVILDMLCEPRESVFNIVARFFRGGYGPGGYYYPLMIQFVFIFPMIFSLIKKYNYLGVLFCGGFNVLFEVLKIVYFLNEECYRLLIFRYFFIMAYGCYLGICKPMHKWRWEFGACLVGFLYLIMYNYIGVAPKIFIYWTGTSCVAVLYVLPLVRYIVSKMKIKCGILEMFGRTSFNVFLVQMAYYGFEDMCGFRTGSRLFDIGLIIIFCLIVGRVFGSITQKLECKILRLIFCMNKKV